MKLSNLKRSKNEYQSAYELLANYVTVKQVRVNSFQAPNKYHLEVCLNAGLEYRQNGDPNIIVLSNSYIQTADLN